MHMRDETICIRSRVRVLRKQLFSFDQWGVADVVGFSQSTVGRWEKIGSSASLESCRDAYGKIGRMFLEESLEELRETLGDRLRDRTSRRDQANQSPEEHSPLALEKEKAPEWVKACFDDTPGSEERWNALLSGSLTFRSANSKKCSQVLKLWADSQGRYVRPPVRHEDYYQAVEADLKTHGQDFALGVMLRWGMQTSDTEVERFQENLHKIRANAVEEIFSILFEQHDKVSTSGPWPEIYLEGQQEELYLKLEGKRPRMTADQVWGTRFLNSDNIEGGLVMLDFVLRFAIGKDKQLCSEVLGRLHKTVNQYFLQELALQEEHHPWGWPLGMMLTDSNLGLLADYRETLKRIYG